MVDHLSALAGVQAKLVAHIDVLLAGKGEDGTDYKAAAAGLAEAQRHWRAFVEAIATSLATSSGRELLKVWPAQGAGSTIIASATMNCVNWRRIICEIEPGACT